MKASQSKTQSRTPTRAPSLLTQVPAQFPINGTCKIAFVGEAPGDYERLYGFPLVGPSGRTFDQILRVSGLAGKSDYPTPDRAGRVRRLLEARGSYLVTNVFNEQLPHNDVKNWCAPAGERAKWDGYDLPIFRGNGYLRPEHAHHLDRLAEELCACQPNLIVPLGGTALWALTGVSDITLARGAVSISTRLAPGTKVLPTYHPAHVMMDWRLFHIAVADLVKAAKESEDAELALVKRRIHIRPTLADLDRWEKRLLAAKELAVDIETTKQQITCIGFAPSATEAFVIPLSDYAKPSHSYWPDAGTEARAWQVIKAVCEGPSVKVFQNGLYDVYYLIRCADIWPANYSEDTRLMHHALYPELPKSLAFMGATYAQQGPWKLMADHRREKRDD